MAAKSKSIKDRFAAAKDAVEGLSKRPSNSQLLSLYGFYKQATEGDVTGSRPGMLDIKGRAKWDAWSSNQGQTKDAAMKAYVELADRLVEDLG